MAEAKKKENSVKEPVAQVIEFSWDGLTQGEIDKEMQKRADKKKKS
jgi:hypothetical protein